MQYPAIALHFGIGRGGDACVVRQQLSGREFPVIDYRFAFGILGPSPRGALLVAKLVVEQNYLGLDREGHASSLDQSSEVKEE